MIRCCLSTYNLPPTAALVRTLLLFNTIVEMAYRGRGRGRGGGYGGFGGFRIAKQEPFVLFPDIELPDRANVKEEKDLVILNSKLQTYWKLSPYYLEDTVPEKKESPDIERYSDRAKSRTTASRRDPLSSHLKLTAGYFPMELIQGSKRVPRDQRKVRWNPQSDLQLDFFDKLAEKEGQVKVGEKEGEKEKKEGENEDDEEGGEQADEEFSDDGDYNQGEYFDDDEDDFNMDDDNDDEPIY